MVARWVSVLVAFLACYVWHFNLAISTQLLSKDLPPLFEASGKCKVLRDKKSNSQFKFCEDGLVVAPGVAIFSCDPGRHTWNTVMGPMLDPDPRGALWALHYTSDSAEDDEPYQLELKGFPAGADFHPLGIDATPDASRLLVSNHGRHNPTIEVFRLEITPGTVTLIYETTLSHPSFVSPNAIAAVSSNAFYLSQDHYFTRRMPWPFKAFLPFLETMTLVPLGWVDFVRFATTPGAEIKVSTVASMIPFANGVAVSPDGSTLAVASTNRVEVLLYKRNETSLDLVSSVHVPFSPDNIAFAGDRLLVGGHPHLPSFMKLVNRKTDHAPSHAVQVEPKSSSNKPWIARAEAGVQVRDVFKSDGTFFSTSSGAFTDLDTKSMFIVGLYAPGVVKCEHVSI